MTSATLAPARRFSIRREYLLVSLFCLIAAARVFFFSAAFPFFNSVDEQAHFDMVVRYANFEVPRAIDHYSEEALPYLAVYGTPEYLHAHSEFTNGVPPPLWVAPEKMTPHVLRTQEYWKTQLNPETTHPPVYYVCAGLVWRVGKLIGLQEGVLLYAVRSANIFVIMALVWVGYAAARLVFPDNHFMRIAVAAVLAFFPQTTFYSINNDVLSPLAFGIVFVCVIRLMQAKTFDMSLAVGTALAMAATYLVKITNAPALAVAVAIIAAKIWNLQRSKLIRPSLPGIVCFALIAAVPVALWLVWMKENFGDFTGASEKARFLGWTTKPASEWWHHPIFTPSGLWTFLTGLISTFWQGEFLWYREPMTFPLVNTIYTALSLIVVGCVLVRVCRRNEALSNTQRQSLWLSLAVLIVSAAFFGFLSVIYDFHECFYPSRSHPYFTSGRLIGAALIPFVLLLAYALDGLSVCTKNRAVRWIALASLLLFMLATEIGTDRVVFGDAYNWFHM